MSQKQAQVHAPSATPGDYESASTPHSSANKGKRPPRRVPRHHRLMLFFRRLRRLAYSDRASGLIMLTFALLGFLLINLPATAAGLHGLSETVLGVPGTNISLTVSEWVQDGLLTLFFLVVGLDLKQELTTGSLANPKKAAVPMIAAVGGMVAPPLLFLAVLSIFHANGALSVDFSEIARGWTIPTATDIAFSLAVLALFAKGLPGAIRVFLMTLATVDDLLGILLIAVLFSSLHAWYWFAGIAVCAFAWWWLSRRPRVPWIVVGAVGILTWLMMFEAGIHPTLSGVLVGLLTPARELHGESLPRAQRYHNRLVPFSSLMALPIFAFFATGVSLEGMGIGVLASPLVIGIIVALVVGKPIGILLVSWLAVHLGGLKLSDNLRVRDLVGLSCACGIGFTVSFLIASLAFSGSILTGEARLAVLLGSLISAVIAGVVFTVESRRFIKKTQNDTVEGLKLV